MNIETYLKNHTGLISYETGKVYDAKYTHEHLKSLANGPIRRLTKGEKNKLIKLGYAEPLEDFEYKFDYMNPTKLAEDDERYCTSSKVFSGITYLLIISVSERYIFGYVSGCFYPFWYRVYNK